MLVTTDARIAVTWLHSQFPDGENKVAKRQWPLQIQEVDWILWSFHYSKIVVVDPSPAGQLKTQLLILLSHEVFKVLFLGQVHMAPLRGAIITLRGFQIFLHHFPWTFGSISFGLLVFQVSGDLGFVCFLGFASHPLLSLLQPYCVLPVPVRCAYLGNGTLFLPFQ